MTPPRLAGRSLENLSLSLTRFHPRLRRNHRHMWSVIFRSFQRGSCYTASRSKAATHTSPIQAKTRPRITISNGSNKAVLPINRHWKIQSPDRSKENAAQPLPTLPLLAVRLHLRRHGYLHRAVLHATSQAHPQNCDRSTQTKWAYQLHTVAVSSI
jgi:hypothetical protein